MLKVKNGDPDKLGLLFERYKKLLFSFFYQMNYDRPLSEDLVQNVFMRILKYKNGFRGDGEFKTWMFHIARNVNADNYRKHKVRRTEDIQLWQEQIGDESPNRDVEMEKSEEVQLLTMAMTRLEEEKREILTLSKLEGIRYKEIGHILNCTEGAVKVKVFRALRDLKKEYMHLQSVL